MLGTQGGGASAWCFRHRGERLEAGEFLYLVPLIPRGIVVAERRHGGGNLGGDRTGCIVWDAGEELAGWLCSERATAALGVPCASVDSALELGAGVGLVAVALGLLGVPRVVTTDGDAALCEIASANAARNGVSERVRAARLQWGCIDDIDAAVAALGGRCSSLVVAADVLYDVYTPQSADALEHTLRRLLSRGGCRWLVMCWKVRNCEEELFLLRLSDLGTACVVHRSEGGDAPPEASDSEAFGRWATRNIGTVVIWVLRPAQLR